MTVGRVWCEKQHLCLCVHMLLLLLLPYVKPLLLMLVQFTEHRHHHHHLPALTPSSASQTHTQHVDTLTGSHHTSDSFFLVSHHHILELVNAWQL